MAKQKKEDNRDVFEKALDYAPVAGGVAGAMFGRGIMKRAIKKRAKTVEKMSPAERAAFKKSQVDTSDLDGSILLVGSGSGAGAAAGYLARDSYKQNKGRK